MSSPGKYRGIRVDNREWVKGSYVAYEFNSEILHYIVDETSPSYFPLAKRLVQVIPETVGQSTGLKDRKGEEIFQGDIVRIMTGQYLGESPKYRIHTVVNPCPACAIPCPYVSVDTIPQWEVIGNIHSTPELLEGK